MTDHPYAGARTLTPGDTADDDPFVSEEENCPQCQEIVVPDPDTGKCPECGNQVQR